MCLNFTVRLLETTVWIAENRTILIILKAARVCRNVNVGGIIKPDVVLYEEMLNDDTITKSVQYISNADVLIIGGTSLNVYPAAGFINYFKGSKLVIINKAATSADKNADLVISEPIGEVLGSLKI